MVFGISGAGIFGVTGIATGIITTPFQFAYNGLYFGAGTDIQVASIPAGLRAHPTIRSGNVPKVMSHGALGGKNYYDARVVQFALEIFAPQQHSFENTVAALGNAFPNMIDPSQMVPLQFLLASTWSEARQLFCRVSKGVTPLDPTYGAQHAKVQVEVTAPDPLIYSLTQHTASTGLPSPTAGLTFPVTFPATFGASTGGSMQVVNAGNETTYPQITITGPCTSPIVTLGSAFMRSNVTLGASDVLVIDMGAGTITLNGTASRQNTETTGSSFFGIPPGTWTIGVGSADSSAVSATFTTAWYDAWGWV